MSKDRLDVLERFAPLFKAPEPSFERFLRRRERKLRTQRIAAGIVAIALFVAPVTIFAGLISSDRQTPSGAGPRISGVPEVDYVIDLNTGVMTPLPQSIIRSLGKHPDARGQYAVSPDGSLLAFVGGRGQIFIAGVDGTGVRQLTHDPNLVESPIWSPDGTKIAYEGIGRGHVQSLFVLDVASGESSQITGGAQIRPSPGPGPGLSLEPQFTPDGSSLLYTGGTDSQPVLRTVPVTGGESTLLLGRGRGGMADAGNGSLSPDGSLVTFLGSEIGGPGPGRWVANADGTERRLVPDVYGMTCVSNPAGTWSPDGSRIVCSEASRIIVVDIATGEASAVAVGRGAIWLDDRTLLVEV
jgi:Tol biopolymer transport system component